MVKVTCSLLLVIHAHLVFGQSEYALNPLHLALSGAATAYPVQTTLFYNPAHIRTYPQVGIAYTNRYLLPELGTAAAYGNLPALGGLSSLALSYFGTSLYNQSQVAYAYGRKLFPWFSAGIRLNYHQYQVAAVSRRASALSGELGMQYHGANGFVAAAHWINPNQSYFQTEYRQALPSEIRMGFGWCQEKDFYTSVQLDCRGYSQLFLLIGAEYWLQNALALRVGLQLGEVLNYSFGLAIVHKSLDFELGFQRHLVLGMSSSIGLNYKWESDD